MEPKALSWPMLDRTGTQQLIRMLSDDFSFLRIIKEEFPHLFAPTVVPISFPKTKMKNM